MIFGWKWRISHKAPNPRLTTDLKDDSPIALCTANMGESLVTRTRFAGFIFEEQPEYSGWDVEIENFTAVVHQLICDLSLVGMWMAMGIM